MYTVSKGAPCKLTLHEDSIQLTNVTELTYWQAVPEPFKGSARHLAFHRVVGLVAFCSIG